MQRFPDPWGPRKTVEGSGFAGTLVMLGLVALVFLIGLVAFPFGETPMDTTVANQERTVVPNSPPPIRGD